MPDETNKTRYREENLNYTPLNRDEYRRRENESIWGGLIPLLLIPLIVIGGYWSWSAWKNSQNRATNVPVSAPVNQTISPTNGVQVGIGGAANTTPTPRASPTIKINPTKSVGSGTGVVKQGVGVSSGSSSSSPKGAPLSGEGGNSK